jgi:hypothetical protein
LSKKESPVRFFGDPATTLTARDINGEPGIVALRDGVVAAVLALTVKDHLITCIYAVVDPRKLVQGKRVLDPSH